MGHYPGVAAVARSSMVFVGPGIGPEEVRTIVFRTACGLIDALHQRRCAYFVPPEGGDWFVSSISIHYLIIVTLTL